MGTVECLSDQLYNDGIIQFEPQGSKLQRMSDLHAFSRIHRSQLGWNVC